MQYPRPAEDDISKMARRFVIKGYNRSFSPGRGFFTLENQYRPVAVLKKIVFVK